MEDSREIPPRKLHRALFDACTDNKLETAKSLVRLYGRSTSGKAARYYDGITRRACRILYYACRFCTLEMAQWFVEELEFTEDEIRQNNDKIFRGVCSSGSLEKLEWLAGHLQLTGKDIRGYGLHGTDNHLLVCACQNNYLDVVQWMVAHFGYAREELDTIYDIIGRHSCGGPMSAATKWLRTCETATK